MNIIIVGCGKVGQKLAHQFSLGGKNNVTVIDLRDTMVHDIVNECDVMGVVGNGANLETLGEAGISATDLLIAVTGSDEINLLTCLLAKKMGDCKTIARVRKPEYSHEVQLLKDDLGLAMVINPEQTAADEIARILRFPSAIQIDTFAKGRIEILKVKIKDDSILDGYKVADIATKLKCDVLVCGVERGDQVFIPGGNFVINTGDSISIIGSHKNVATFFRTIGIKTNRVKDTIIVGGGDTAYYLAKRLIQSGVSVKLIEKDSERCEALCQLLPKAMVINADGTENSVLLECGIEYAESFVALTNIDEENVLLSLFVKSKTDCKVVTKINRIEYDEVITGLDLDTVIYPKNITAEYIEKFVRAKQNSIGSNIETIHKILNDKAEALEFNIEDNSPISDIPLEELSIKDNVIIACVVHDGKMFIPRGQDMIKSGDTVIVVTANLGFRGIEDILS